jgi:hypothetical protein
MKNQDSHLKAILQRRQHWEGKWEEMKRDEDKMEDLAEDLRDYVKKPGRKKDADTAVIKAFAKALDLEEEEDSNDDWPWTTKWI